METMGSISDIATVVKRGEGIPLPESSSEGLLFCCLLDQRNAVRCRISSLPSKRWGRDGLGSALPSVPFPALRPGPFLSLAGAKEQLCRLASCLLASQSRAGGSFAHL